MLIQEFKNEEKFYFQDMENGSYSAANEDVEKLQDVIRQLELQNAKLRQRIPAGKSPKVEKHDVGELTKNLI